jgi:hypothetical protein
MQTITQPAHAAPSAKIAAATFHTSLMLSKNWKRAAAVLAEAQFSRRFSPSAALASSNSSNSLP